MSHEYEHERARSRHATTSDPDVATPGQDSRSQALRRPERAVASGLVQRKASTGASPDGASVHEIADRGMSGAAGRLPHLETIQRAFGAHDVSGVRAFVGGAATAASRELGAHAYARGDATAFASEPDLHTAAHEAAHVIQQRAGVQLKADIGEVGDRYEQHADAVADLVVQGRSAEALLGAHTGGASGRGLQLLSDGETEKLGEYLNRKVDDENLTVSLKDRAGKVTEIAAKYQDGKKELAKATAEVDGWIAKLKAERDVRIAQIMKHQADKTAASQADKDDYKSPAPSLSGPPMIASGAQASVKPKYVPLDLSQVAMPASTPLTGFSQVAQAAAHLPQPAAASAAVSQGPGFIAKIKSWQPSTGHDGCNGTALSAAELQEIADWAAPQATKYFVKKGKGTGGYAAKNQLKIIHKVVTTSSNKKATYHITATQAELDKVQVDEEDEAP
jgi:hypothetical protein